MFSSYNKHDLTQIDNVLKFINASLIDLTLIDLTLIDLTLIDLNFSIIKHHKACPAPIQWE